MSAQKPQGEPSDFQHRKSFFARVRELTASIPETEWEKLPTDLSRNYKHYLYGHPKKADD